MKNENLNPAGKGYHVVNAYIMVSDIQKQMDFMKAVFGAEVKEALRGEDGIIHHGEIRIHDCVIMIGRSQSGFTCIGMNYVFVSDCDAVYRKALELGSTSLMEPGDRFYGFREGGFRDVEGHQWWIAQVVKEMSLEEMERAASKQMGRKA
jgi:PhnB protein